MENHDSPASLRISGTGLVVAERLHAGKSVTKQYDKKAIIIK
jgi:hypothetical protein